MSQHEQQLKAHMAALRFDHLYRRAWHAFLVDNGFHRGPVFDTALKTSSHGTIALISYLRAKGL